MNVKQFGSSQNVHVESMESGMQVETAVSPKYVCSTSYASTKGRWLSVISHLDPSYGGLSTVVPQLAAAVGREGHFDVEIGAFCPEDERETMREEIHLPVSYWPTSRKQWLLDHSLSGRFAQCVAQADGVHVHGLWEHSSLMASRLARAHRKPYIISAHGMLEPWALRRSRFKKQLYAALLERPNLEGAACLHALTQAEAMNYREFGCRAPIAVIPNGVSVPAGLSKRRFLDTYPEASGKRLLLFLGRLHAKKGVDLLIQAWARIAKDWPDAMLVLAGPAEDSTRVNAVKLVGELGIGSATLFTGMLPGAMKWSALAAAEVFVLPSYSEGLSVATLEAMGAGVPVIVTNACNLPQVVEYGCGWQIRVDVEQLTAALASCLENAPEENSLVGARGAALVASRYSWPVVASQMAELYTWVQGGVRPGTVEMQQ